MNGRTHPVQVEQPLGGLLFNCTGIWARNMLHNRMFHRLINDLRYAVTKWSRGCSITLCNIWVFSFCYKVD